VALALLPETLDADIKHKFPVVEYSAIRDILHGLPLIEGNPYHFFVREYRSYLTTTLEAYDALREYCTQTITFPALRERLSRATAHSTLRDNDIRTYTFFYYWQLRRYLEENATDLVFGELSYDQAKKTNSNTRWIPEKNLQGPPFMEAIIYSPFGPGRFRLNTNLGELYHEKAFEIAPRIELWLDLNQIAHANDDSTSVGTIMLGFFQESVIQMLRERQPYKDMLNRLRNSRNLNVEKVPLGDICFSKMADRLRATMRIIGSFHLEGAR